MSEQPEKAPEFICATCAECILNDTYCYAFERETTPDTEGCMHYKLRV
jgi:hypothetical protein